jgi:spore coat polysaccharide biosynthesis protein SpsF (cytidylyltransferase family)
MCGLSAPAELRHPEIRLDVDTPEDLRKMETIVELGTLTTLSSAGDVVAAALAMA